MIFILKTYTTTSIAYNVVQPYIVKKRWLLNLNRIQILYTYITYLHFFAQP